ncbi:zinc dependent phospholipase C family protein [Jeotgalibacillus salarius]|uniref:Hydrolase n=1 Tax=Jeotgalibacillus salarius TaxID=546023 RepID=A0A4Y8LBC6_9BACL|nr:zinc dependent phospholipase C family protein [Jeotgalibacillus salarius]TFD99474.1 hydrolase [Jeotgalibacillus salarius]
MGSRIMHLVIANRIAEELSIEDKGSFLLGAIAPDAVSPKDLSHFYKGSEADYSRAIDHQGFLEKYNNDKSMPFIQGYYTHLLADDIWLTGFYLPWLRNRMKADQDIFTRYHNDFRLLNGKLLDHYGSTQSLKEILEKPGSMTDIEEVTVKEVAAFIPYVIGDMAYEQSDIDQPLSVFTLEQIIGYVETSVERGVACLSRMNDLKV